MFAAVRHPDIEVLGVITEAALDAHRARGWYRVSPWVAEPADLYLPEFEQSSVDLDEPTPEPVTANRPADTSEEQAT